MLMEWTIDIILSLVNIEMRLAPLESKHVFTIICYCKVSLFYVSRIIETF